LANCCEVITVRESTPVTSMDGSELADTVTPERSCALPAVAAALLKDTSVPAPTRMPTLSRVETVAPLFMSATLYVPTGRLLTV
jgi:hypothetical protein